MGELGKSPGSPQRLTDVATSPPCGWYSSACAAAPLPAGRACSTTPRRCFPGSPEGSDCPRNRKNMWLRGQKTYIRICLVSPVMQLLSEGQTATAEEAGRGIAQGFRTLPGQGNSLGLWCSREKVPDLCPAEFTAHRQRKPLPICLP